MLFTPKDGLLSPSALLMKRERNQSNLKQVSALPKFLPALVPNQESKVSLLIHNNNNNNNNDYDGNRNH